MEWIEVTGKTLEAARERALDELGVHDDELEVEVVEEPRAGFLGMGRTDARIRARVRPVSREKPDDRRRRRGSGRGGQRQGTAPPRRAEGGEPSRGERGRGERPAGAEPSRTGAGPGGSGRRRRRGGRGGGTAGANEPRQTGQVDEAGRVPRAREGDPVEQQSDMPISEQRDVAVEFLQGVADAVEAEADVTGDVEPDDDVIWARVDGEGLGMLIGPNAATLDALEELTRSVVQRAAGGGSARVRVDVAGYRERRREALRAFTLDLVDRVRETGAAQALEPMTAPDRKVVHDVVAEVDGVETSSEGDEPRRHVVIRPA